MKKKNKILGETLEYFPADQTFELAVLDGCVNGNFMVGDSINVYFADAMQPIYFVAADSVAGDSGIVRLRVGTDFGGSALQPLMKDDDKDEKLNDEQTRIAELKAGYKKMIVEKKKETIELKDSKQGEPPSESPILEVCYYGSYLYETGYWEGDVVVKQDECDEEIVVCENLEPQILSQSAFEEVHSNIDWHWIDENGTPKSTNVGDGCSYMPPNDPNELEFGKVYFMEIIGTEYEALEDMIVKACLDESDSENKKWRFNLSNIRIPIMNTLCLTEPKNRQWRDFGDGSNTTIFETYIGNCIEYDNVMESLLWQIAGGYLQESKGIPLKFAVYSSKAVQEHEDEHVRQLKRIITEKMNQKHFPEIKQFFTLLQSEYPCPEDAVNKNKNTFKTLLKSYFNGYNDLETQLGNDPESGIPISERDADIAAHHTYLDIYNAIYDWVAPPQPEKYWYVNSPFDPQCYKYKRIEIEEGE